MSVGGSGFKLIVEPKHTAHLWMGMHIHLAVESILAGATEASMFADDAFAPHGAVTWTGHRLYLTGKIDRSFSSAIEKFAMNREGFVAYPSAEALEEAEALLANYNVKRRVRLYYEGNPTTRMWAIKPQEGYSVERITDELLSRRLVDTDLVRDEMCSERVSVDEFLAKGFGFAAIHGGCFVCWCTSEYNLVDRCEVGIETVVGHRKRGLASLVASEMLKHAASIGIKRVGWHCWADNTASVATAEKLGLSRVAEYTSLVAS